MKSGPTDRPRATRWEILGARLRIWTLPRGVQAPPPLSRRAIAAAVAAVAAAGGVLALLVVPAIDRSKDRTAAQERAARARFVARERARLTAEQRAHRGRSAAAARLHAARDDAGARAALLADARARIGADARARVAAGLLDGPIREVRCGYDDRHPAAAGRVHLECLAVTASLEQGGRSTARSGHPFTVSGSLRDGRFAWCKENAPPGEGASGTGVSVTLPVACTR
ncbi:MAG TPA: hypothetical protein VL120_12585 [Solirubrobacteraceae bacterium]|nr:hypothetical protein [Solirubrobacteraceae bacterium]